VRVNEGNSTTLPRAFAIRGVSPNPAFSKASVAFDIPEPARASLAVFDIRGRRVGIIAEGDFGPGNHTATWNPESGLAPGVYFIRMSVPGFGETRKIILLSPAGP